MSKAFVAAFSIVVILITLIKLYEDVVYFRKKGWNFHEDKPATHFDAEYGFDISTDRVPPQLRIFVAYPMLILIASAVCAAQLYW